jgi:hypothetical protein
VVFFLDGVVGRARRQEPAAAFTCCKSLPFFNFNFIRLKSTYFVVFSEIPEAKSIQYDELTIDGQAVERAVVEGMRAIAYVDLTSMSGQPGIGQVALGHVAETVITYSYDLQFFCKGTLSMRVERTYSRA